MEALRSEGLTRPVTFVCGIEMRSERKVPVASGRSQQPNRTISRAPSVFGARMTRTSFMAPGGPALVLGDPGRSVQEKPAFGLQHRLSDYASILWALVLGRAHTEIWRAFGAKSVVRPLPPAQGLDS